MMKIVSHRKLSEILSEILKLSEGEFISMTDIISLFGERSFPLLMIVFALPAAVPLPLPPGVSLIFGVPLLILSWQMLRSEYPKLPVWILKKKFKVSILKNIANKLMKYIVKIENFSKIRGEYFITRYGVKLAGFVSMICSVMISAPLIFNKTLPSISIIIMCLGLLNKDLLLLIIGIILSFFSMSLIFLILIFGGLIYKNFLGKII